MVLHRFGVVAPEVRALVDDQRVVRHGRHGERAVLTRVVPLVLGLDVEPAGGAVVGQHLVAVVVVGQRQLVVVAVAQPVGSGLEGHGAVERRVGGAHDGHPALIAVAAVAVERAPELQRLRLAARDVAGHGIAGIRGQHPRLVTGRHVEQLLVRRIGVVGDIDGVDQLLGVVALFERIVETHETPFVRKLQERRNGLFEDAVAVVEDAELGPVVIDALGEDHEGPDGVALVVGPLRKVAVGRKEVVELPDEPAVAACFVGAVERLAHQRLVVHRHADHAHGRGGPGGMVVHAVEDLVVLAVALHAVHQEIGHRPEQVALDAFPLGRGQVVVDAVVGHGGVDQPHALVERLPEDAARCLRHRYGMEAQRRVEIGIGRQHVGHAAGIPLVARELPGDAAVDHLVVVELVPLVGVAAPAVARLRHGDRSGQRGIGARQCAGYRSVERGHLAPVGAHGLRAAAREHQRRVFGPRRKQRQRQEGNKKYLFHDPVVISLFRCPPRPAANRHAA